MSFDIKTITQADIDNVEKQLKDTDEQLNKAKNKYIELQTGHSGVTAQINRIKTNRNLDIKERAEQTATLEDQLRIYDADLQTFKQTIQQLEAEKEQLNTDLKTAQTTLQLKDKYESIREDIIKFHDAKAVYEMAKETLDKRLTSIGADYFRLPIIMSILKITEPAKPATKRLWNPPPSFHRQVKYPVSPEQEEQLADLG